MNKAFAALDPEKPRALHEGIAALLARFNREGTKAFAVPSDYLEVVITKA